MFSGPSRALWSRLPWTPVIVIQLQMLFSNQLLQMMHMAVLLIMFLRKYVTLIAMLLIILRQYTPLVKMLYTPRVETIVQRHRIISQEYIPTLNMYLYVLSGQPSAVPNSPGLA